MYKCTECGSEFEKKPDYCDCGNNEFVLTIVEEEKIPELLNEQPEIITPEVTAQSHTVEAGTYNFNPAQKFDTNKYKFNSLAVIFFVFCLIFSVYIDFIWNPVDENPAEVKQETRQITVNKIHSINELWKDGASVAESVQTVANTTKPVQKVESQKPKTNTVQTNVQKKNISKQPVKTIAPTNTKKITSNTQKTNVQTKSVSKSQTPVKQPVVDTAAQKAAEEARKQQETRQKAEQEARLAADKAKKAAEQKQELARYKINLRNALGQKIDFTKVIGDGDCAITFKIDSSGRLINRTFAKQSSNITLNNAVYNAVMSLPSYNSPPALYNNETLRLNIRFYNGNFAITLE